MSGAVSAPVAIPASPVSPSARVRLSIEVCSSCGTKTMTVLSAELAEPTTLAFASGSPRGTTILPSKTAVCTVCATRHLTPASPAL